MKQVERISENKNYTAINIGNCDDLKSYSLIHAKTGKEIKGKLFLKELIGTTGTEISFTVIAPKTELGFFHIHTKDEEVYIVLQGEGYYQVDDDCFPIKAGSIIRVSPEGKRSLCNTSEDDMIFICIQSKENSLDKYTYDDGKPVEHTPKWDTF